MALLITDLYATPAEAEAAGMNLALIQDYWPSYKSGTAAAIKKKNADPASSGGGFFDSLASIGTYWLKYDIAKTKLETNRKFANQQMAYGLSPSLAQTPTYGGLNLLTIFLIGGVLIFGVLMIKT